MTRYRVTDTPNAPGLFEITGRYVLTQTFPLPSAEKLMTYDEVVPNYHIRSAKGEIFNNPFSSTRIVCAAEGSYSGVEVISTPKVYNHRRTLSSRYNPALFGDKLNIDDARARCRINALGAVNGTEVDAGAFAGEWHKTRTLHRTVGNSILKAFNEGAKYKKGSFKRIPMYDMEGRPLLNSKGKPMYKYSSTKSEVYGSSSRKTGHLADVWLGIRMGLAPLLSELEGACRFLSQNKALRRTARGREVVTKQSKTIQLVDDTWQANLWVHEHLRTQTVSISNGILYETTAAARAVAQLGGTRLASTLWELTTFSFMIDWFVNVGAWLDAVQPSGAHKTLCAWESTHDTIVDTMSVNQTFQKSLGGTDYVSVSWKEGFTLATTVKSRNIWVPTVPSSPALGSGFSTLRSADFAALIVKRLPFFR